MLLVFTLLAWRSTKAIDETWITWVNKPPSDIPFEKSTDILGWDYLNNTNYQYGGADTWYFNCFVMLP